MSDGYAIAIALGLVAFSIAMLGIDVGAALRRIAKAMEEKK